MSAWTSAASQLTRSWVAAYTLGLASTVREARRREISSDLWEHQQDAASDGTRLGAIGLSIVSRMVRGIPADLLWRTNVEGPQMDIRIPFERIVGGLLIGMVVLMVITGAISGYDTSREGFESELVRLASLGSWSDNGNAFFRFATGLALIGAAAGLYTSLRGRSPALAAIAAFGLLVAAVLELVASSLQMVFVQLANEYVQAPASEQASLVPTARAVAIAVEQTTGAALFSLLASIYVLAVLTGRENLVPRWLIGVPMISAGLFFGGLIGEVAGAGDDATWIVTGAGLVAGLLWLLIAGLWLMFTPRAASKSAATAAAGAA